MNRTTVITFVALFVMSFIMYSIGYSRGSNRSSDDCREIARDLNLIAQMMEENGGSLTLTTKPHELTKYPTAETLNHTNCPTSHDIDAFDYGVYQAQHSEYPIVRVISMLVPDLYYRTIFSVRINGETYNKLNLNADFNCVTNISIVRGSDTCLVYRRPRLLQDYNKHIAHMFAQDENNRRLFRRCDVLEEIITILPDIFDRGMNTVRIDNVFLGDFNLSTEFKSINHIEVLEDGNWVTVYKRPDMIILPRPRKEIKHGNSASH